MLLCSSISNAKLGEIATSKDIAKDHHKRRKLNSFRPYQTIKGRISSAREPQKAPALPAFSLPPASLECILSYLPLVEQGRAKALSRAVMRASTKLLRATYGADSHKLGKQWSDTSLSWVAVHCPNINMIDLSHSRFISSAGLKMVALQCTQLHHLNVRNCEHVTDVGIRAVTDLCCTLKSLDVAKCSSVSDQTLKFLSQRFKSV